MAKRMIDKTAKQTMLSIAEDCDRFAVRVAMRLIDELVVSATMRIIEGPRGADAVCWRWRIRPCVFRVGRYHPALEK
jgi:hypothetical protein